jgi:hypothetical protein
MKSLKATEETPVTFQVIGEDFFWWGWGLNSGLHSWKAGIVHLALIILEMASHKLFTHAGFEVILTVSASPVTKNIGKR